MKKILFFSLLFLLWGTLFADHLDISENFFNPGTRIAVIADLDDWDILSDITMEYRGEEPLRLSFSAGAYYRLHKNLKAGLFYNLKSGQRHDDDWVWKSGSWVWEDSSSRVEQTVSGDLTPRFLLPFIPGENWVFSIKNRYSYNFYDGQQSYFLMPAVTWFYMKERNPVLNIQGGYALYFPVNFSESLLYKQGPWLDTIFHLSQDFSLEWRAEYLTTHWTVNDDIVSTNALSTSLGLLWTPEIR